MTLQSDPAQPPRAQVLIVEDEPDHAEVMADALRKPGHVCTIVHDVPGALEELEHGVFDVVVTDLRMPNSAHVQGVAPDGADAGLLVLRKARELQPSAAVVIVTAHGDVPTAREAFKEGAYDFIEKPLDLEVFRNLVNRAAETAVLRSRAGALQSELEQAEFEGIVAISEPMRRVLAQVKAVAASDLPVLITGESGVGKELVARAVHRLSRRAQERYVVFNCAGQSESLLEDQLFGHVRGAYTGADRDREGVFEYADGGTIFLDEIGDMPLPMQAKLLRTLESGEVVRLGSNEARHVDVRVVSATNRDLQQAAKEGTFREDLYFRINGAHIHVPPLRDRREDIPPLVRHAIARYAPQDAPDAPPPDITDTALLRLTAHDWPGNVRQLLNVVRQMVVTARAMGDEVIDVQHLPPELAAQPGAGAAESGAASLAGVSLEQLEKRAIRETLRMTGGNREQTAKLLGIGERTLYRKLKEYGLR